METSSILSLFQACFDLLGHGGRLRGSTPQWTWALELDGLRPPVQTTWAFATVPSRGGVEEKDLI